MRIGLGCTMLENSVSRGQIDGIGYYTKCLLEQLQKLNQQVIPYSFPPMKQWRATSSLPQGRTFEMPYMATTALSLLTTKNTLLNNIDIFHAPDHLVPKLKNIPVIATLHDALILKRPEWYSSRFRSLKNWIRKRSLNWADHVIASSHSMIEETVEHWGIKENKISVVPLGIDDHWFNKITLEQQQTITMKYGIPSTFLLIAGTLQPKKNVPRVIDAFLALPQDIREQYPLVIVGKDGWNTAESLAAIERLIKSKTGYWLRYLPEDDLQALFQAATLYLHVSLHEGFGLTLLQSFASETPVLTSNITAMPETAGGAAYLVDPLSPTEITIAIKNLLLDKELRATLVRKGNNRARELSWARCAEQTLAVYRTVV